jgi:SAM-dependent methyltransferase
VATDFDPLSESTLNSTRRYYDEHAEEFCASTFSLDMSELYRPFVERLPKGGRVLDAGCGSGRDAMAFSQMGYEVVAFDASAEVVRIAREQTGMDIQVATFDSFQSDALFDGIWACASLLHLTEMELQRFLKRVQAILRPGGVLYASFKMGDGITQRGGRVFLDLSPGSISDLVDQLPDLNILQIWESNDLRADREAERWVNALIGRKGLDGTPNK